MEPHRIMGETELVGVIVVRQRAYQVPKDVAEEIEKLREKIIDEKKLSAAINRDCNNTALERNETNAEVNRLRAALITIAEHYTDTDLAAKHMSAYARAALSPTGNSFDYV